jgi:hypothetical protein
MIGGQARWRRAQIWMGAPEGHRQELGRPHLHRAGQHLREVREVEDLGCFPVPCDG